MRHQVDKKSRRFGSVSYAVVLMYAELTHSISQDDVYDSLRNHGGSLKALHGFQTLTCRRVFAPLSIKQPSAER